jgi:hypothetical protein
VSVAPPRETRGALESKEDPMKLPRDRSASVWTPLVAWIAMLLAVPAVPRAGFAADSKPAETKSVATKETALQRIQKSVARINAEASTPEGEAAVLNRLSKQLAVPPDTLRAQQQTWGLGYGEVAMVYSFSRASRTKATPAAVVEMRRSGMEWDAIGKELGVKVDTVASRMRKNVNPKPPAPAPASK